jgi:hypothetical protein
LGERDSDADIRKIEPEPEPDGRELRGVVTVRTARFLCAAWLRPSRMTIIAHSKRLIALHDADGLEEPTAIDLRICESPPARLWRRDRAGTPRAEIAARLAQARAYFSAPDTTAS